MTFLMQEHGGGYPAEYLLARIGGRRSTLIREWETLLTAPDLLASVPATRLHTRLVERSGEELWAGFLNEASWLFRQMNVRLRTIFAPLYSWFEIRTVTLALRFGTAGEAERVDRLLAPSLLAPKLKQLLVAEGPLQNRVDALGRLLANDDPRYRTLASTFRAKGVQGAEETLVTVFLDRAAGLDIHPTIKGFFRSLVDTLNILQLHKQLRWRPPGPPRLLTGGTVPVRELTALLENGDPGSTAALVRRLAGTAVAAEEGIEPTLLAWLSRRMRRLGREPDGIGAILDYLWRCYLETRNLSLLVHTEQLDRDRIREELVL